MKKLKPRIDGITYLNDGSYACTVVVPGRGMVYRTRRYKREDRDGTVPALRAMREAERWLAAHKVEDVLKMKVIGPE